MPSFYPKESIPITRQIEDPSDTNTYYVRAYVRDAKTDELLDTVNLTDKGDQRFRGTTEAPHDTSGLGRYITITTRVFTDSGYITESPLYGRVEQTFLVQERWKFGMGGGGGSDVSYKKIKEIVEEVVGKIPKTEIPQQKEIDLAPVLKAIDRIRRIVELFEIPEFPKFPEIPKPEKVNLKPVLEGISDVKKTVKNIKISDVLSEIDLLGGKISEFYQYHDSEMIKVKELVRKELDKGIVIKVSPENIGQSEEKLQPINFKRYFALK